MKKERMPYGRSHDVFRRLPGLIADALAGRMGMAMMLLSYASFAVVLLAYVSTQVYTSSLMEDISELKRDERMRKENIGLLMSEYAALASRTRVLRYCEEELGMVQANTRIMKRVAVDVEHGAFVSPIDFSQRTEQIHEVLGANLSGITEVIRQ